MTIVFKIIVLLGPGGSLLALSFLVGILTPFPLWALFFGFAGLGIILLGLLPPIWGLGSLGIAVIFLLIAVFVESANLPQHLEELWQGLN